MMEADRVALCGPKGVPDEGRRTVRGGSTASRVVLGGQCIAVRRLRARSLEDGEQALPTFEWVAAADPLHAAKLAAIAASVSMRRYAATQEPVPAVHRASAASKSAVSRRFVKLSQEQLKDWLGQCTAIRSLAGTSEFRVAGAANEAGHPARQREGMSARPYTSETPASSGMTGTVAS